MVFNKSYNLQKFFNDERFKNCENIKINWLVYSDNDLVYYENKPLMKRFTTPVFTDEHNAEIKTTVRGNLGFNYWSSAGNSHTSGARIRNCNSIGKEIEYDTHLVVPPIYEIAYLNHYKTKAVKNFGNDEKVETDTKFITDETNKNNETIKNVIKICLCAIGKKENLYINEYINHYKKIGYSHIYLYDNNEIGDEKFEDIINETLINTFVTIIDYRELKGKHNYRQIEAYKDCYEKYNKLYDWLSFFDLDEFLVFNKSYNLQRFFNDERFKNCENIKINWLVYTDNDLVYYENKPLMERFTTPAFKDKTNAEIKTTVRGNLGFNYWSSAGNSHTSGARIRNCNSIGKEIKYDAHLVDPPIYEIAYLKHYISKTIEEFCIKIKRGYPIKFVFLEGNSLLKRYFDGFFRKSKKTKEKLDYIKKIFNYTYV